GATAAGTDIDAGGIQYVGSGAAVTFTTVYGGGTQQVGGSATFIYTYSGGTPIPVDLSGGVVSNTSVTGPISGGTGSGGVELVSDGGKTVGTSLGDYGVERVFSGGVASGTVVGADSVLATTQGGAVASGTFVGSSGMEQVQGTASASLIGSGGLQYIASGGVAVGATLDGGSQIIGGFTSGGTLAPASASGTIVNSGGAEYVGSGATVSGTVLNSGGTQQVGGTTSFTYYLGHATSPSVVYLSGGVVSGTSVNDGAHQNVESGGTSVATAITNSGVETVFDSGTASGTTVSSGGDLVVQSGGTITGTGLLAGGTIDLAYAAFASGASATLGGSDVLTVHDGASSYTLQMAGDYTGEYFHLANDGNGGTDITVDHTACYCRGTLILTDHGEVPVEDLEIGDRLITVSGEAHPLKWIGRRSYSGRFASHNRDVLPITFKAGVLDGALPKRDLHVSPLHAMFIDDVLIPAFLLVNGTSIVQAERVDMVEYFHLELESHDIIVAEGALSESFVDDDSRGMFHNAKTYDTLYPDAPRIPARYCAPRVEDGELLEAIRNRLLRRTNQQQAA
ncbi:MAG TPA: Hint domain-containing protein, partial [Acidiphilium sp.]